MKKVCTIIGVVVLLAGLVSIAFADAYQPHYSNSQMLCTSDTCKNTYRYFKCISETKNKDTVIECPDDVVNCVCILVKTTHNYVCTVAGCNNIVLSVTYSYQHSH